MSRTILTPLALLILAGCGPHHGQSVPNVCLRTREPCQGLSCGGGNSPYTNLFPVNGLSSTGACNSDEIQLMPGSLHGAGCGDDATLEMYESENSETTDQRQPRLVGTRKGEVVCEHGRLKGASFTIRSGGATVDLTIDDFKQITEGMHSFEAYRITHAGKDTSVCDYDESLAILKELGFNPTARPKMAPPAPNKKGSNEDFVVAMAGPIYNVTDANVIHGEEGGFFNLACADDALAKTAFFDLRDHEKAALRMITAKYASKRSYTVRGMVIDWRDFHTTDQPPPTEALWAADGKVLCLEHPRLLDMKVNGQNVAAEQLPAQPNGCASGSEAGLPGICNQQQWLANLQKEANVAGKACASVPHGSYVLQSWSDPNGKLILTPKNQPPVTSPRPESAPTNQDHAATR